MYTELCLNLPYGRRPKKLTIDRGAGALCQGKERKKHEIIMQLMVAHHLGSVHAQKPVSCNHLYSGLA